MGRLTPFVFGGWVLSLQKLTSLSSLSQIEPVDFVAVVANCVYEIDVETAVANVSKGSRIRLVDVVGRGWELVWVCQAVDERAGAVYGSPSAIIEIVAAREKDSSGPVSAG